MNLQDLERAISILYNPQNNSEEVITQAQQYCDNFIINNAANLVDFFKLYVQNDCQLTRFWLLQAITQIIDSYYPLIIQNDEQKQRIHEVYIEILKEQPLCVLQQTHSMTKYALIFVMMIKHSYPERWQNAFQQILQLIGSTSDQKLQKLYMKFIVKVMITLEEELVERVDKNDSKWLEISNKVKDGIRQFAINDIIFLLSQALMNYQIFEESTINEMLLVLAQLIDWNSLEMFGPLVEVFQSFLQSEKFRKNALKCLHAIVYKGMDYPLKVELIVKIQFMKILGSFQMKHKDRSEDEDFEEQQIEEEFFTVVAEVVDKLGQWCLELFQNQEKLLPSIEHQQQYDIIFSETLQISFNLFDSDKPKIGRPIIEFLTFWLQGLKKQETISEQSKNLVAKLLQVVIKRLQFPSWCKFDDTNKSEYEEDYTQYREELVNIFQNIAQIKACHENVLKTIAQLYESIIPGKTIVTQAEVPLFLTYHLQQAIPSNMREAKNTIYTQLMQYVIKVNFLEYDHKIVSSMLLENLYRYSSYFADDENFAHYIFQLFFSKKAIYNNDPQLTKKSCYLLLRLCEKQQGQLATHFTFIVENTFKVIQEVESGQNTTVTYDDLLNLYSLIGLFSSNKKIDFQQRQTLILHIMESLYSKLNSCQPMEQDKLVWILKYLNVFSKGFQPEVANLLKESFVSMLQTSLRIMSQNFKNPAICDQVLQFLQRSVTLLRVDVLPYLSQIAVPYIQYIEADKLEVFINILNFTVITLKYEAVPLIELCFLPLFQKISLIQVPTGDMSEIQKTNIRVILIFLKLVSTTVAIDTSFLLSANNQGYFIDFLKFMIIHFEQNIDKACKKAISLILKDMIFDFTGLKGQSNQQKKTPEPISENLIQTKYPQLSKVFLETVLAIATQNVFLLNSSNLEDCLIIKNLTEIQALFIKAGFIVQMQQAFTQISVDLSIQQIILQLCESLSNQQIQSKAFHENYLKLLKEIRQK